MTHISATIEDLPHPLQEVLFIFLIKKAPYKYFEFPSQTSVLEKIF